jgi:CubicO group peptidase (beta-lactamase class C family)
MAKTPIWEDFDRVRGLIRGWLVDRRLPSLAVAVALDGQIVWEEAFGWANREAREPATPHTLYSLASISKPITMTALMILVERGLIDLDRPINDYLGAGRLQGWAGDAAQATVRRVAQHTAGLPLHYHFFYEGEPYAPPPMDETIRRYGAIVQQPGDRYTYSNLGYGILGYVVERVSGRPFGDFLREEVFLPLGLTRASLGIGPGLEPYQALRYGSDGVAYPFYDFDHPGGSAVYASAHDLVRFGMFHLKEQLRDQKAILTDASIDAMQALESGDEKGDGYALGWGVKGDDRGYRVVSHSGGMGGVNTTLRLIPSERIAIVTLANAESSVPFDVAHEIQGVLLPDYGERLAADLAAPREESEQPPAPQWKPERRLQGEWRGTIHTYAGDRPLTLRIRNDGDVHARIGDGLWTLLNEARWEDGALRGRMMGDIGTGDAAKRPYLLHLTLRRNGAKLGGAVAAISESEREGGAPGLRYGNALSYWAELTRAR